MRKLAFLSLIIAFSVANAAESPLMVLEAENATLTPPVKVKRVNGYSGNAYVGDFDPGSVIRLNHVTVDKEGPYEFRVYYTSMFNRTVNVNVGSYPTVSMTIKRTTPEWDRPPVYMMLSYIWLDEGDNTIIVTPPSNDGGPNIDKFEIWETTVNMPKPELRNAAYPYDLSDDAVSVTFEGADVKNSELTDNDVTTVFATNGSAGYIQYEFDTPYLITGYLFSEGVGASAQGAGWTLEYSTDNRNYVRINPSQTSSLANATLYTASRQPHADRAAAAKYFRVKTNGHDIAEVQLFGLPYISASNNKNFPADITEGMNAQNMVTGYPLGATGWADERYFNLFDRNMQTKYYTDESRTCQIEVELPSPKTLESYTLTSCQDYPERDPKSWVVEGFDTGWETISEVRNFEFPCRYATMRFEGDNSKLYRGFRIRVTENNGADRFQLLKMQMFGSDNAAGIEATVSDDDCGVVPGLNSLSIRSASRTSYYIYKAEGTLVAAGECDGEKRVALDAGFYLVALSNESVTKTFKIIVR